MSILIFTDGSSRGNPGPGGWGAIVHAGDTVAELGGGEKATTNNRMELAGAIGALEWLQKAAQKGSVQSGSITIKSDSKYVIQGIMLWVAGWKRNGWKTAGKKDVSNRDLWEKLSAAVDTLGAQGFSMLWNHVDGHVGIAGNERCDQIATSFADGIDPHLYIGPFSAYTIDLHAKDSASTQTAAKKKKSRSNSSAKAYSYLSLIDGELQKHTTWAECEARVKGVRGAKFKKSLSASDEADIIKEWGA